MIEATARLEAHPVDHGVHARNAATRAGGRGAAALLLIVLFGGCNLDMPEEQAYVKQVVADIRAGKPVPLSVQAPPNREEMDKAVAAIRASRGFSIDPRDGPYGDSRNEACINGRLEMREGGLRRFGIRITRNPRAVVDMTAGHRCVCRRKVSSTIRNCYLVQAN